MRVQIRLPLHFARIFAAFVAVATCATASLAQPEPARDSVWQTIVAARGDAHATASPPPQCPAPGLIEQAFVQSVQSECLKPYLEKNKDKGPLVGCIGAAPTVEDVLLGGYRCHKQANDLRIAAFEIRKVRLDEELSEDELELSETEEAALRMSGDQTILAWSSLAACAVHQAARMANADTDKAKVWQDFLSDHLAVQSSDDVWKHAERLMPMAVGLFQRGPEPYQVAPSTLLGAGEQVDWAPLYPISKRRVASKTGASFTAQDLKRIAHLAQDGKGLVDQRNQCQYDEAVAGYEAFASKAGAVLAEVASELQAAEKALYCRAQSYGFQSRSADQQDAFMTGVYLVAEAPQDAVAVLPHANWQRLLRVQAQLDVVANGVKQDLDDAALAAHKAEQQAALDKLDQVLVAAKEEGHLCSAAAQENRAAHLKLAQEMIGKISCPRTEPVRLKQAQIDNMVAAKQPGACVSDLRKGVFVHLHAEGRGLIFAADGTSKIWEGHETVVAHTARNDDAASFKKWALQQISLSNVCAATDRPMPHAPDLWLESPSISIIGGPFATQQQAEAALPKALWRDTGEMGKSASELESQNLCRPEFQN